MTAKQGVIFYDPAKVDPWSLVDSLGEVCEGWKLVAVRDSGPLPKFYPPRQRKRLHWGKRFQACGNR